MVRISVRIPEPLHRQLMNRAAGADLSFSLFVRRILEQGADPGGRYIYSSKDEILATCVQILAILGTSIGERAPDTLRKGMEEARILLGERGLLDPATPR